MHFSFPRIRIVSFVLLIAGAVQSPFVVNAQLDTTRFTRENGWIEGMNNFVTIKLSLSADIETFSVDSNGEDFDLYPNTSTLAKLHFNYRFLSFNVGFAPSFLPGNGDENLKGKTESLGFAAGLNFPHWFHQLTFSRVKGFYLNNSADFPVYVPGGPYLQVPDMRVVNFQSITGYSFNPRFSVRSLTTQTERQLRSTGSFIPVASYRYYITDNKTANATSSQKSGNFEIGIGAGYHYTFVFNENYYASLGFTPGVGYIFSAVTTSFQGSGDIITRQTDPIVRYNGRAAMGYNGRAFFAGCIVDLEGSSFKQEGTTAINTNTRFYYQIFLGLRVNAPNKLRDKLDVFESIKKKG